MKRGIWIGLVLCLAPLSAVYALELFVAPNGDDANPGTQAAPLQTLEAARDRLRELRAATDTPEGATVTLLEGRYPRHTTFELGPDDSGAPGVPATYRAAEGAAVFLDGGLALDPASFHPVTEDAILTRLPESARGRVYLYDLAADGVTEFGDFGPHGWGRPATTAPAELYLNGVPQTVARWPNEGSIPLGEVLAGGEDATEEPGVFRITDDRAARWTTAEDPYLIGLFGVTWAHDMVGVADIDLEAGTITTREPHSYGFRQPGFPGNFTTQYHVVNLLEEIDQPGEYYIDREASMLYYYPPHPLANSQIYLSQLAATFLRLENAAHLRIEGLTFEYGRDRGIVVSGGMDVQIRGGVLRALGLQAIAINGGEDHLVESCDIYHVGMGGIGLNGGDRPSLTPAEHVVRNCDIHRYNRWIQYYNPAVTMGGVGNTVSHNHMHHALHQAVTFSGNEHEIAYNEIHRVLQDISDMGSIYIGRDPTYAGNIIRHNFFHHLALQHEGGPGVQAIFLDDDTIYVAQVFGNVFYSTGSTGVIKFHGGGGASVANNIALASPQLVQDGPGDVEGIERAISKMLTDEPHGHGFPEKVAAMNIAEPPYRERYPYIYDTYAHGYNEGTPRWNNFESDEAPDFFVDPDNLDFTLREDAPLLDWVAEDVYDRVYGAEGEDIPFQRIPFEEIGLYTDAYRTTTGPLPFHKLGPVDGATLSPEDKAQLWWAPAHNADHYRVIIAANPDMTDILHSVDSPTPHLALPADLDNNRDYYWHVHAVIDQSRSNRGQRPAKDAPWQFRLALETTESN